MKLRTIALAAALLVTPQASHAKSVTITYDYGGFLKEYVTRINKYNKDGTLVKITGVCISACVMYTGLKKVCVTPNATFLIHQGNGERATNHMLEYMDTDILGYVEEHWPLPKFKEDAAWKNEEPWSKNFLILKGSVAIERGFMEAC